MGSARFRFRVLLTASFLAVGILLAVSRHRDAFAQPAPTTLPTASVQPGTEDNNPSVAPGKVRWHPSFADAQAAAQRSGKPVLLFHMLGQLDRQFC
jgi:hypothetical protein